jgi:hypothetical protein
VASGTATLDFGAFPGKGDATVAVTGQTGILAGSLVGAWIRPVATATHTADEHLVETLAVNAGNIVAGTGFTIYGFEVGAGPHTAQPSTAHLLYGTWTIAWAWT